MPTLPSERIITLSVIAPEVSRVAKANLPFGAPLVTSSTVAQMLAITRSLAALPVQKSPLMSMLTASPLAGVPVLE